MYYGIVLETLSLLSLATITKLRSKLAIGNLHDDVHWIDYYHHNPSGFFSLMQIRATVI